MLLIFLAVIWQSKKMFKKESQRTGMLVISVVLILYHGVCLISALTVDRPQSVAGDMAHIPSRDEITKLMAKAKMLPFDTWVALKNGPKLSIPGGFKYTEPQEGGMLCYAEGPNGERLVVTLASEMNDLGRLEANVRQSGGKDRVWKLGPSHQERLNNCDGLIMDFNNPVSKYTGYMVLASNRVDGYSLLIVSPEGYRSINEAGFQNVIHTFAVSR